MTMAKKAAIIKSEVKKQKIWGCDVWTPNQTLHGSLSRFANKTNLIILKVPVRERGLTSSGKRSFCWYNVNHLVETFGGKTILGWYINKLNNKRAKQNGFNSAGWAFAQHAIWLNNQNKASCVTKANIENDDILSIVKTEGKKKFILFAVYGIQENYYDMVGNLLIEVLSPYCVSLVLNNGTQIKNHLSEIPVNYIKECTIDKGLSASLSRRTREESLLYGTFSEPSVVNQKMLEEIKFDRKTKGSISSPTT